MSIVKRRLKGKAVSWGYRFDLPGSTKTSRLFAREGGFATRQEAIDAEAAKRLEVAKAPAAGRRTLAGLIEQWHKDQAKGWSPKTGKRYLELATYLAPEITSRLINEVTALDLHREWGRLAEVGGHTRGDQTPRSLSAKTVRNIAGMVSAAYSWGMLYGLASSNPVSKSKPPRGGGRKGIALSPAQQTLLVESATGPWCLPMFIEVCCALGVRRGEALALRWSDIAGGFAYVSRSLCQVGQDLIWKDTKTGKPRRIEIPESLLAKLIEHRRKQDEYRAYYGSEYAAGDLIFATPDGKPLRPDSISASVSALCRRLKLDGASLHTLRHSHGSQLVASGVPIPEVAERLGHSSPATTLAIYTHAVPDRSEAARKWDEFQAEGKVKQ